MASLGSMQNDLRYWNNQAEEMDRKIRKLKKRRSDVEAVKTALAKVAGNNAGDVNSKIRSAGQKLDSAIGHSGRESQLDAILAGKNEQGIGGDGNLTSADGELQRELNEVNRQLGEAEAGLTQAKNRARSLKSDIAEEEKRQREEAIRRVVGGVVTGLKR